MNAQAPSHRATVLTLVTAALLLISTSAHAVFYTPYDNWSSTTPNTYGTPGTGSSATFYSSLSPLTPANSGVASYMRIIGYNGGTEGQLSLVSLPMYAAGTVSFDWSYTTPDTRASYDEAGYFILHSGQTTPPPSQEHELARNNNPSQASGVPVSFSVAAGDRLGFWVYTKDGTGGAPTFTISNFSGPLAAVPEASAYLTLAFAGLVVAGIARRRKAAR
jgi:hypothetical protein